MIVIKYLLHRHRSKKEVFMRIAIVDDDEKMIQKTYNMVEQYYKSLDVLIDCYTKSKEFWESWIQNPQYYQLLLFDIEMPETDGIELAKRIREQNKDIPVIFLTSYMEYVLKGYEVNALRYLTKPLEKSKLFEALKAADKNNENLEKLLLHDKEQDMVVYLKDIVYMEVMDQDIYITMATGEMYKVRYNLKEYETQLKDKGFVRCHRSYLINMKYIKSLEKNQVLLGNGTVIPISRMKKEYTKTLFYEYIQREAR